ncbi:MAG TPA: hypothetical protein EYQ08_08250 [Planctomycetes bacterium]|nr:hypothetical protein [Planctomycetota bacterium]
MNEDQLKPTQEGSFLEETPANASFEADPKLNPETESKVPDTDLVDLTGLADDEVIVFLEDDDLLDGNVDAPALLSHRPGEDLDELEDLPEVSAELEDDLPEIVDVEDITSLIEGSDGLYEDDLNGDSAPVIEQVKNLFTEYWKPGAVAASVLVALVVLINVPWSGSSASNNESTSITPAVVSFENWVDDVIDQHQVGFGAKK